MRFGAKRILWALCAGPAVAATLITGSSAASAAALTPVPGGIVNNGPHGTSHPNYGPSHPNCSKWQLERWNLNGSNTITAVLPGSEFQLHRHVQAERQLPHGDADRSLHPGSRPAVRPDLGHDPR